MQQDIYKTPEANLTGSEVESEMPDFLVVSIVKFFWISFATFGFYLVYWFYKNWKYQKEKNQLEIWPVMRAIFSIFFVHSLCEKIDQRNYEKGIEHKWSPMVWATLFVIVTILSRVYDQISARVDLVAGDLISICLVPLSIALLIAPQKAINVSQGDPLGKSNSRFTWANIAWMVPGVILWLVVCFGFYALIALEGV